MSDQPAEYYCRNCKRDLVINAGTALGQFHVHAHNGAVACEWPGVGWSLFGTNADPVKRDQAKRPDGQAASGS